jgi:tetratricopeptide (TPR) repeat protein
LTQSDPKDAEAWFNYGLSLAWLGENLKAIEALGQGINLETDPAKNTEAAALIEVLRCGQGVGDQTDYIAHSVVFRIAQPQAVIQLLQTFESTGRIIGLRADQRTGMLQGLILEDRPNLGMGIGNPVAPCAAHLIIVQDVMRLWNTNKESLSKLLTEIRVKLTNALIDVGEGDMPAQFGDVALEAMSFPHQRAELEQIRSRMEEHATFFFEETWVKRSLRSLAGLTPEDAAKSETYRKRLMGVVLFLEQCFSGNAPRLSEKENTEPVKFYDFDRLRNKLGLGGAAPTESKKLDVNSLSLEELTKLNLAELSDADLEQAFRSALRQGGAEEASHLARSLISRPASGDRFFLFNHLIEQARLGNKLDDVLSLLESAEQQDREANEGKRANDYLLKRGQTLVRRGEVDRAIETFETLLKNAPTEGRYFANATESMLGLKKGAKALAFAEAGLVVARSQNNRDLEGQLLELAAAARKLG